MKLLFIDHECHRKTRSAEFFLDILRKSFEVKELYYSRHYRTGSAKAAKGCDVAVIWEFPISRRNFFFDGKKNVFVPMYDNEWASRWQWRRIAWSGMGVISFCDKVTKHARRCGVKNILDVRYFPDPASLPQTKGDPRRVFLWERGEMDRSFAERLFPSSEGYSLDIKGVDELLDRDVYLERMSKCGIVIAPRRKEGIGMAFLEAMGMGKCVVANNDATMNEYIKDGENGILFNVDDPRPISSAAVMQVLGNVVKSAAELRARWMESAKGISAFVESLSLCRPSFGDRLKIALSYPLYLAEGAVHVLVDNIILARRSVPAAPGSWHEHKTI